MMKHIPASFKIIYAALGLVFLSIIVKLYILAIARHDYYDKLSRENTIKTEILVPTRGQILDRNGEPLAINEIGFSLSLKKGLSNKSLHEELEYIKSFIEDIDTQELNDTYIKYNSRYRRTPVTIIEFLPYSQMQVIYAQLLKRSNVVITPVTRRFYPNNSLASHVIGYIGASDSKDRESDPISKYTKIIGKQGLEKQYNSFSFFQIMLYLRRQLLHFFQNRIGIFLPFQLQIVIRQMNCYHSQQICYRHTFGKMLPILDYLPIQLLCGSPYQLLFFPFNSQGIILPCYLQIYKKTIVHYTCPFNNAMHLSTSRTNREMFDFASLTSRLSAETIRAVNKLSYLAFKSSTCSKTRFNSCSFSCNKEESVVIFCFCPSHKAIKS